VLGQFLQENIYRLWCAPGVLCFSKYETL